MCFWGIEPYHLWKDEENHRKGDWKDGVPLQPSYEQQDEIFQHFIDRYPNLQCIGPPWSAMLTAEVKTA